MTVRQLPRACVASRSSDPVLVNSSRVQLLNRHQRFAGYHKLQLLLLEAWRSLENNTQKLPDSVLSGTQSPADHARRGGWPGGTRAPAPVVRSTGVPVGLASAQSAAVAQRRHNITLNETGHPTEVELQVTVSRTQHNNCNGSVSKRYWH